MKQPKTRADEEFRARESAGLIQKKQRFGLPCLSSTRVPTPAKKARTVLTQFIKTSPPVLTTVIREEKQIDQLYL